LAPVSRPESGRERVPAEVRERGAALRRDGAEAQVPGEGDQEGRDPHAGNSGPDETSGADFMITIFAIFANFLTKKLAFFSKTNVMTKILHNLPLF
jgi:hypothetical protein